MTSPFELKAQPNFLATYDDISPNAGGPIYSPSPNDVLSGRGGRINSHKGNVYFRQLVSHYRDVYLSPTTRKLEKIKVAEQLVMQIRRLDPPGRFLKEGSVKGGQVKGAWYEIGDFKARKKAGQAMREKIKEEKCGEGIAGKITTLEDIAKRDLDKLPSVSVLQPAPPPVATAQKDPAKLVNKLNSMAPPPMVCPNEVIASLPNSTNVITNDFTRRVSIESEAVHGSITPLNHPSGTTTPEQEHQQQALPTNGVFNGHESYNILNNSTVIGTIDRNSLTVDNLANVNQFHNSRVTQVSENSEEIAFRANNQYYEQQGGELGESNRVSLTSEISDKTYQTTNQQIITNDSNNINNNLAHYYTDDQCPTPPVELEGQQQVAAQQQETEEEEDYKKESQLHPCTEIDIHNTRNEDYDAMVSMMSLGSFSVMDTNASLSSLPDKDKIFDSFRGGNGSMNAASPSAEEDNVVNSGGGEIPSPKKMTKKDRQRFFLQRDESYATPSLNSNDSGSGGGGSGSGSGLTRKDRQRSLMACDSSTLLGDRSNAFSMRTSYLTSLPSADEIEDVNNQPIVHAYQQSRNKTASVSAMSISMGSLSLMDNGASHSNMVGSAMNTFGGGGSGRNNGGGPIGNNMPARGGLTNTASSSKNNSSVGSSQQYMEEEAMSMVSHESPGHVVPI